jgi:aquaporin Z
VLPYWVVQFAGAICAALFLQLMFGDVKEGGNYPIATSGGEWKSLVMETVLTAILVSVILNTAIGHRSIGHNAAIAVGGTVALLGLFASPISGASMNPARTLGPDIVANDYTGWWIYIAGPVIGAAIAVAIINAVRGLPNKQEREAAQGGALPMEDTPTPTAPQELTDTMSARCSGDRSGRCCASRRTVSRSWDRRSTWLTPRCRR